MSRHYNIQVHVQQVNAEDAEFDHYGKVKKAATRRTLSLLEMKIQGDSLSSIMDRIVKALDNTLPAADRTGEIEAP